MQKNSVKDWILENFSGLTEGQEVECRGQCACYRRAVLGRPKDWECGLGVRREHGALSYNCFKPSCPVRGGKVKVNIVAGLKAVASAAKADRSRVDEGQGEGGVPEEDRRSVELPQDYVPYITGHGREWLVDRLGVSDTELVANRIGQIAGSGQVVVPVYDLDGPLVWYQQRRYYDNEGYGPKWTSPKGFSSPIYVPRPIRQGEWGVITEDALSAIRAARVTPAVGLLGTAVSDFKLSRILRWARRAGVTQAILCLDSDAIDTAEKLARWLRPYFKRVVVFRHAMPDPKYWPEETVRKIIDAARQNSKGFVDEGELSEVQPVHNQGPV